MRIETIGEPLRLDGKQLCLGCEESFVPEGYCAGCEQLNAMFERKRLADEARLAFGDLPRMDAGTVEYARPPIYEEMMMSQYVAGALLLLAAIVPFCVGSWFIGKHMVLWLLKVTA